MSTSRRILTASTVALAVMAVQVPSVSAATDSGTSRVPATLKVSKRTLNTDSVIAKKLGTSVKKLRAAIKSGASISQLAAERGSSADVVLKAVSDKITQMLAAEVSAGRLTQAQADALLTKLTGTFEQVINRALNSSGKGEHGPVDMFDEGKLATLLGITEKQLEDEIDTGASLLSIAVAHGVTQDALVAFLTTEATAKIDAGVTAGKITQTQADEMKAALPARIDAFINRVEPKTKKAKPVERREGPGDLITKKDVAVAIGITEDQLEREIQGVSVADVALAHGVAISTLSDTLNNVAVAKIAAALTAGKVSPEQAQALRDGVPALVNATINQTRGVKSPAPTTPGTPTTTLPGSASVIATLDLKEVFFKSAAAAIKITEDQLEKQMKSGLTVLQIAVAKGATSTTVTDALVEAGKTRVAKAVADGKLSQVQAQAYVSGLGSMVNGFVTTAHHED